MTSLALSLLLVFAAGGSGGLTASRSPQSSWNLSDNLVVETLADDVWLHTTWKTLGDGVRFPSNGLIVRLEDTLLLVDTAWGLDETEDLLAWIARELELPVAASVVTHFHEDRLGGIPALAKRGIPVFSHPLTLSLAQASKDLPRALPSPFGDVGSATTFGEVEIFYPGPAHTEDNLVAWLPAQSILFGGCAVRPGASSGLGNTADADLAGWPRAIERLLDRYPAAQVVVPSHGPPGDIRVLEHTLTLFD